MLFRSNDTATTEIYTVGNTLSLHDALPISHAADAIGETDEYQRCLDLLDDCDRSARSELGLA